MAVYGIRVDGLKEFTRALKQGDAEIPKRLKQANREAASTVASRATVLAGFFGPHKGGGKVVPIKRSIRVEATPTSGSVVAGGTRTPHAAVTEFGGYIPRRGHKGMTRYARRKLRARLSASGVRKAFTRVKKQSYIYAALEQRLERVVDRYADMVESIAGRLSR